MKFKIYINLLCVECVAPLVGAWIEISIGKAFVGAWIEIQGFNVRGCCSLVAPLVGAWIEIYKHGLPGS